MTEPTRTVTGVTESRTTDCEPVHDTVYTMLRRSDS